MVRYLNESQRIEILMMIGYGDRIRSQNEVAQLFNEKYPDMQISQSCVSKIFNKFQEFGHVRDKKRSGHPSTDEDTRLNVLLYASENPITPSTSIAETFDLSRQTAVKIMKKHKFHPYKIQSVQELSEDDFDRRIEFCEQMTELIIREPEILDNLIFSDEATFFLSGNVHKQNCRFWADHNPHWVEESHTQRPQKLNVWCGFSKRRIFGPYFFDAPLTGEIYLDFLRFILIPALAVLFPNPDDPDIPSANTWFQQDGAPPHFAASVRAYLNEVFNQRWIGRRGHIEWPARSPDMNPLDFFLWGYLKQKVFREKPANLEELKEKIVRECREINQNMRDNVIEEFNNRLYVCQVAEGKQFEHLA